MKRIKEFSTSVLRHILVKLPRFKIIPPPKIRENGISITIRVKNEVNWIKYCLLSFKDFADEIIIADNGSTDGSVDVIKEFITDHPEIDIKFYDRSRDTYLELSNFVLQQAKHRWIMRVDADCIAKTSGKYSILKLRKRILQLDPHTFYAIKLNLVLLFLDFFHTLKGRSINKEYYLFTYSQDLACYRERQFSDIFFIPIYYRLLEFTEPFIFHLSIRNKQNELEHIFLTKYFLEGSKMPYPTYLRKKSKLVYGTDSLAEAADKHLWELLNLCAPINCDAYDGYPEILKPVLENPPYKIIYDENGKIKGRIEPGT